MTTVLGDKTINFIAPAPSRKLLDTFDNVAGQLVVPFVCNEFTSICPVTGQPDFARFEILYIPADKCIESKSLKLYLFAFRNHGEFHEEVTARIADDIITTIAPRCLRVFGDFKVRGGISIKPMDLRFAADVDVDERAELALKLENYDRLRHWD